MAMIQSDSAIDSSSSAGDEISVATITSVPRTPGPTTMRDTCECRTSGESRSCYECLNTKLLSGDTCVVDPFGECLGTDTAASLRPYFNSTYYVGIAMNSSATPHDNGFYWSSDATYCRSDDVACSRCRTMWINEFHNGMLKANFSCVGGGGCICTAYCELRGTSDITLPNSYNVDQKVCAFNPTRASSSSNKSPESVAALVSGVVLSLLILRYGADYFFHKRDERRMRERRRALREQRNQQAGHFGLMLTLEGWNGYREQLIEREQENLGLKSENSILTAAPSRISVQEGEDFRPASPSQLTRQLSTHES